MFSNATLKHLAIVSKSGLCNRLRAIASAKRVCNMCGAQCTAIWDWGNYKDVFATESNFASRTALTTEMRCAWHKIYHLQSYKGGNADNRRLHVYAFERIVLFSSFTFNAFEEPGPIFESELRNWLPQPSERISMIVRSFVAEFLNDAVGMHMRRTDHRPAREGSPDDLYFAEASRLADEGRKIFLATDNRETEEMMKNRFGSSIIIYPKNPMLNKRWPRSYLPDEVIHDVVDLFLLAACDYIIGSAFSSFSRIAMLYNGSSNCKLIRRTI